MSGSAETVAKGHGERQYKSKRTRDGAVASKINGKERWKWHVDLKEIAGKTGTKQQAWKRKK